MNQRPHETLQQTILCCLFFVYLALTSQAASTAASGSPKKIVRQYALTSANDFPLRDPQDWRLLASNDDGKSWVQLDQRRGEVFTERHQRRVFSVPNRTAYNLYRLQIDRIRDPAGAESVQLAELEPLGDVAPGQNPLPLFADEITAGGANPPAESEVGS